MINLLPDTMKKELQAARTNVLLLRYIVVLLLAGGFIGLIMAGSMYLLGRTEASAQNLIEANDTKAGVYSDTRAQVEALSSQLSSARTILDQEVQYSKVLVNLAQLLPANTVINELTLNAAGFGTTPTTVTVYAKTSQDAILLRERFQSSPLFTNVSFQEITEGTNGIAGYPVSISMTFTFNKEAAQ